MSKHIVISFSHQDLAYVEAFYERLNQRLDDFRTKASDQRPQAWYYPQQPDGNHIIREIRKQIRDALAVIIVCSQASMRSAWVEEEFSWAFADKKYIIAIGIDPERKLAQSTVWDSLSGRTRISSGERELSAFEVIETTVERVIKTLREADLIEPVTIGPGYYRHYRQLTQRPYGGTFEAFRIADNAQVVIKKVASSDSSVLRELDAKVALLKPLHHSVLPRIEDYLVNEDGQRYLVWTQITGRSFGEQLANQEQKRYRWDEIKPWIDSLFGAVSYLHSHKLAHLGIKPVNLVLTRDRVSSDRKLMLLDTGLDHRPPSAASIATPDPYLAPEQLDNRVADGRADIYALGTTLYTLLTGDTQPYPGKSPVVKHNPEVPTHVSQAIAKAMSADPSQRYQDVMEFLAALKGIINEPHPVPPPSRSNSLTRTPIVAAGALVAVLVLVFAVWVLSGNGQDPSSVQTPTSQIAQQPSPESSSERPLLVPGDAATAVVPSSTAVPTPEPTPEPPLDRQDDPCGFEAIAAARIVRIAVAAPLTGSDSDKGEAMVQAACLALKNVRDGEALPAGVDLRLAVFDDQGDKTRAGTVIAPAIVADPSISCIVGHRSSDVSIEALKVYTPNARLMISPSNSNPQVREEGGIVLAGNDIGQSAAGVAFITDTLALEGREPILIISDETTYAKDLKAILESTWATGAVSMETVIPDQANAEALILSIDQKNDPVFQLIYIAVSKVEDMIAITPALRERFPNVPIMVTDASDSPRVRELAIPQLYISTMAMPADRLGEFGADYEAYTGTPPTKIPAYTAETYDATLMCIKAIARVADEPTPQAVHDAWKNDPAINEGYPLNTQTGPYRYNDQQNFSDGGTYFISDGSGQTVAKYKCAETQDGSCVRRNLPTLP